MDKRVEENIRVKTQIANAYFTLLNKLDGCDPEVITITQITSLARVSRMAYYRNFQSRHDIVDFFMTSTMKAELEKIAADTDSFWSLDYGVTFFRLMKKHRDLFLLLDRFGYSSLILDHFNATNESLAGDIPANSVERFNLYFAAGATFNASMVWLREGCRETPEEMSRCFARFCSLIPT